jgi:hypothetical protein
MHKLKATVTVTVNGVDRTWSADATTDLEPFDFVRTMTHGVRDQAGLDLLEAKRRGTLIPLIADLV